jgi:hypothetical protein
METVFQELLRRIEAGSITAYGLNELLKGQANVFIVIYDENLRALSRGVPAGVPDRHRVFPGGALR